jgi:hypothetical protein
MINPNLSQVRHLRLRRPFSNSYVTYDIGIQINILSLQMFVENKFPGWVLDYAATHKELIPQEEE